MSDEFYQMIKGVSEAAVQPLCKLIDAVRAGAGLCYEPVHIRRMAMAEGESLIVRGQAELALEHLKERAAARLTNTETRRQENIESIVEKAAEKLPDSCSEKPVDPDWMASFFDCCKDVGNEDVQQLWGQLLSDEVSDPGTYSRRALDALRLMSTFEAALFQIIGYRVWKLNDWPILLIPKESFEEWPKSVPFAWRHVSSLGEIGLLDPEMTSEMELLHAERKELTFEYHGRRYVGRSQHLNASPSWIYFTKLGKELLPLVTQPAGFNDQYFESCCRCFDKPTWTLDSTSKFREFTLSDDMSLEDFNLNKEPDE